MQTNYNFKSRGTLVLLVLVLAIRAFALGGVAVAGTTYELACTTDGCQFKIIMNIGGGIRFEQVTGFCAKCGKSAQIRWMRKEPTPQPLLEFWDTTSGTLRRVYACPDCRGPFVAVSNIADFKHCPVCKKESLKARRRHLYD
ncbi:MAG: hypothetical protein HZC54_21670 [Verrucomicrobia bacterium]|nr:hypothetical protein [Verrucomicrobiota bacterium]